MRVAAMTQREAAQRVLLLVSKVADTQRPRIDGAAGAVATVLEAAIGAEEPGFAPPVSRRVASDGTLRLGGFAVALVFVEE